MKVVVSSTGTDLDAQIDPRFGRCAYFIMVDTDNMAYESFDNGNMALGGGAGIQSAQFVASKGAKVVITGNCGPNAVRTLSAAGVEIIVGQSGSVRQAIEDYKAGHLKTTNEANVSDHYGMGDAVTQGSASPPSFGSGMGGGMGRGGGMGCKRGMGQGMGRGGGMGGFVPASPDPSVYESRDPEVESLKNQVGALQEQIEALKSRLKDSDQE